MYYEIEFVQDMYYLFIYVCMCMYVVRFDKKYYIAFMVGTSVEKDFTEFFFMLRLDMVCNMFLKSL